MAKDEAERFLGLPAVDLCSDEATLALVKAKFEALTAGDAVVDCCLQYYPEATGAVKHRLLDTEMTVVLSVGATE